MTVGRRPKPTLLKLIRGDRHKERLRDDKPKLDVPPTVPSGTVLTEAEQTKWTWLIDHVYVPHMHGAEDAVNFLRAARLWARAEEADRHVAAHGIALKNTRTGKLEMSPYARASRELWHELGSALGELGASPIARVKLASPIKQAHTSGAWDGID